MKKAVLLVALFLLSLSTPLATGVAAQSPEDDGMAVLYTAVNPSNNNTYHLLSASSWEDAASYARSLDGFLVTVDDEVENTWLFDTFASWDNQSRHLWTGLSDHHDEGEYRWHDGTPFLYRSWGEDQPSEGGDEHYVHIASTNMGNILPGTWNDLENDPQYFPVYGVVEIGPGADYALRFDGDGDHVVLDHDEGLDMTDANLLELSAWVYPYDLDGNQFVVMKGDYGWGMYLKGNQVAYASEYSLSQHPVSNGTLTAETWSHIQVSVETGVGYTFHINGEDAGTVLDDDAGIPLGDFGSNDCYENELDCDEFYVARMGAGCDCNHFEGVLDNITVRAGANNTTMEERLRLDFPEGEGGETWDASDDRMASIEGADWVMPDGSIVAQAVQLFPGEEYELEFASEGDTLLFFIEIEEYTRSLFWLSYSTKFDDFEEMAEYTVFMQFNEIPDEWNHETELNGEWGFVSETWEWPDEGVMWFTVVCHTDLEDLVIEPEVDMADPPPTLDDMTELMESIPVTNQVVNGDSYTNDDYNANYYFVNVTEPLADLRVRTYDGRGNVDIGISYYSPPTPTLWWEEQGEFDDEGGKADGSGPTMEAWSTNPGNNEEVHLFDLEPGLYYITAYSFRNAREFTIVADFVYPPENVDPEDAIVLTPGVEYGLLSGYEGLNQYFKVDVPQGTERLVVDLNDGAGQAALFMRFDQAPTASTYDHHSTAEGAGDRIAFNDPTPGWWYILLNSESAFTGVNIVAEFADRYVWDYDGTPLELYNDEPLEGISVPAKGEVLFYALLDEPGNTFVLESYGGSGDITITIEGTAYEIEFEEGGGRPGMGFGVETVPTDYELVSGKDGTSHLMTVTFPMNGRIDITLAGVSDAEEVSLVARWDESMFPVEPFEPEEPNEPADVQSCSDEAEEIFGEADLDEDGVLDSAELKAFEIEADELKDIDINGDGTVEFREALQLACTCDNELISVFDQFVDGREAVARSVLERYDWENSYDFESVDANGDEQINEGELELLMVICETTYDAFDGDGDGVPDDVDAFPDDPSESKDTDGDGVGDNADIVASVSNDIIYASAGALLLVLAGLLIGFLRSNRSPSDEPDAWGDEDRLNEAMFGSTASSDYSKEAVELPPMVDSGPPMGAAPSNLDLPNEPYQGGEMMTDLLAPLSDVQQPPAELMGMVLDGVETVEYPTGSGTVWTRSTPDADWQPKA